MSDFQVVYRATVVATTSMSKVGPISNVGVQLFRPKFWPKTVKLLWYWSNVGRFPGAWTDINGESKVKERY